MPEELIPRLKERCKLAGIDWNRFRYNDNSCYLQVTSTRDQNIGGLRRRLPAASDMMHSEL